MSNIVNNCCVNMVDIGASGGIHPRFKKVINNLKAVLFEPDPREFNRLKNSVPDNYVVLNTALADSPGEVIFYLCKK
jgi:FkbM family methyltransferase